MTIADFHAGRYELSKSLQEIDVSQVPFKLYCKGVNELGKICVGRMGSDYKFLNGACIGDSGSPLICENETGKYMVGITVGGSGTCEPLSLIITYLNSYNTWLRKKKFLLSQY